MEANYPSQKRFSGAAIWMILLLSLGFLLWTFVPALAGPSSSDTPANWVDVRYTTEGTEAIPLPSEFAGLCTDANSKAEVQAICSQFAANEAVKVRAQCGFGYSYDGGSATCLLVNYRDLLRQAERQAGLNQ